MKAKRLSFAFICFLESGLFNELRPIQIKKLLPASTGCSGLFSSDAPSLDGSGQDKLIAQISVLDKKLPSHSGADIGSWPKSRVPLECPSRAMSRAGLRPRQAASQTAMLMNWSLVNSARPSSQA